MWGGPRAVYMPGGGDATVPQTTIADDGPTDMCTTTSTEEEEENFSIGLG